MLCNAISGSSLYDFSLARVSKHFYMIFNFHDDCKMKSSGIIGLLKMELVSSVTETCLPSLSDDDVRSKILTWTGQWALRATVCV